MSGANLAYHLRVNKHIDRCLFIEALEVAAAYRSIEGHGYVSMGGNFLEDFRVIHQEFAINRMYSFDASAAVISRQEVNKPFGFIKCEARNSTQVVQEFDQLRTAQFGENSNVIVWLDYTMPDKRHEQLVDVEVLTTKLIAGDVFRVTMNANRIQLGSNESFQRLKETGKTDLPNLWEYRYEQLVNQMGAQLPDDRKEAKYLQNNPEFFSTLARCIKKAALNGMNQRPQLRIEPLLSVAYSDGQEMITVTAIVLREEESPQFWDHPRWIAWPYKPGPDWDDFVEIDVPHLSQRDRHSIHSAMIDNANPGPQQINFSLDSSAARNTEMFEQDLTLPQIPDFCPARYSLMVSFPRCDIPT